MGRTHEDEDEFRGIPTINENSKKMAEKRKRAFPTVSTSKKEQRQSPTKVDLKYANNTSNKLLWSKLDREVDQVMGEYEIIDNGDQINYNQLGMILTDLGYLNDRVTEKDRALLFDMWRTQQGDKNSVVTKRNTKIFLAAVNNMFVPNKMTCEIVPTI
jgi:hypothetical protein